MPDSGTTPTQGATPSSGWIVGPVYDGALLIGAPALFFVIGVGIWAVGLADLEVPWGDGHLEVWPTFALTFTMAHVVAVFFRSHGNTKIFRLHRVRFTVVPLALFALFVGSKTAFLFGLVFATWFDNWHSSLQTFGIARLYDMRAGNDPHVGRKLDMGLALVTFLGPILAGATLAMSLTDFARFDEVGLHALTRVPGWVLAHQAWWTWPILGLSLAYIVFYVVAYVRLAKQGYRYSKQKVALWVTLALVSVYTWGFDSFGQAFLIMESFHSLQYFALLWWSEKKTLARLLHVEGKRGERPASLALLIIAPFAFGLWTSVFWSTRFELALFLVVEIMHYWWDGFIWSVRKKQVR
jgi:hypothetical protein